MSSSEKLNNDSFITKQMNLEECCNCFGSCSTASEFFCRKNDIVCLKPVDSEAIENSENHNVNYDHCLVTRGDEKLECLTLFEAYPVEPFNSEYGELIVANNCFREGDTIDETPHVLVSGDKAREDNESDADPLEGMSLSSQISDSLSLLSIQDDLSTGTSSSAYYSESILSSDSVSHFRVCIFPHIPPTIRFVLPDQRIEGDLLSEEIKNVLKWKITKTTPLILKKILISSGFAFTNYSDSWLGMWGKHLKAFEFSYLHDYQKVNHHPGTFQIGRKDRLWRNLNRLQQIYSLKEFNFVPTTFVLPCDMRKLWLAWNKKGHKPRWIVKPPAAARGKGVHVIHKFSQLPKHGSFVVQRYISQPYLINGLKFDLRLYVYVPSFNPLRIYVFDDGLVRFASTKYSNSISTLGDPYIHLTNSSVNKSNVSYKVSDNGDCCNGHKWSLKALWGYLRVRGIDTTQIWNNVVDIIIKTIISCEPCVGILSQANVRSSYNCHEVFGFDIMLDSSLKPWLLEVNISPSLHSNSSLDVAIKGTMLRELLNLARIRLPPTVSLSAQEELAKILKIDQSCVTLDVRLFEVGKASVEEKLKQDKCIALDRETYTNEILNNLTPRDVFILAEAEDELVCAEHFQRVFPSSTSHVYHKYFNAPQYYTYLLDAFENKYHENRSEGYQLLQMHCNKKVHYQNLTQTNQGDIQRTNTLKSAKMYHVNRREAYAPRVRWLMKTRFTILSTLRKFHLKRINSSGSKNS